MCCFSGPADASNTKIFARHDGIGGQFIVYQMDYASASAISMILPLPVSDHSEDAVEFLSLEGYPDLFRDLNECFIPPRLRSKGGPVAAAAGGGMLQVHNVGAFEASFVPTLDDFDRLDPRFKLPRAIWDQLPAYADYGFAVFKLRTSDFAGLERTDNARIRELRERHRPEVTPEPEWMTVHPMAFRFPTRRPDAIYFPTVHIHDGQVHEQEEFDHSLYLQGNAVGRAMVRDLGGEEGTVAHTHVDAKRTNGIVHNDHRCFRAKVEGLRRNEDIWLAA